ncbi:E3 SUMO-protein ligase ZBED1-like [Drosophila bipectinata]|uniref:E3 SUMO-protein ligase ZBED1-like n=1 Tax=Drosophila bipectinata TaxID=42026 RepID=UPI001C899C1D|nr:E3 SUMO-protein ligase ZBED1-like isoform X1 [Drosophila bipectinata]
MDKFIKRTGTVLDNENDENIPSPKRTKKEISKVWEFFKKGSNQTATCLKCGKVYKTSGNTSNLMQHLNTAHHLDSVQNNPSSLSPCMDKFLNKTKQYENGSARKAAIDKAVLKMIAKDVQPFSVVTDPGFIYLVKTLDPMYKLPSKTHMRNVTLKSEYEALRIKLQDVLNQVEHVGITTDCWTSKANEGYITVTVHFISSKFDLQSAVLSTDKLITPTSHSADTIAASLKSVLTEWDLLRKVTTIVTDNDASMVKACRNLELKHLPCFAHTINLLVQEVLKLPMVSPSISKCKRIVSFFKSSTIAYEKFKQAQGSKKAYSLVQEVPTRWNSALYMVQRILATNDHISTVLLVTPKAPQPFSAEDIFFLEDFANILEPFEHATRSISQEKNASISILIPVICELNKKMVDIKPNIKTTEGKSIFDFLTARMPERFAHYEARTVPRVATILDSRFKKDGFLSQSNADQAAKALENELFNTLSKTQHDPPTPPNPEPEKKKFTFLQQKVAVKSKSTRTDAIIALRQYLEAPNSPENVEPLEFYKTCPDSMEALKSIAKQYFCVPASSTASERIFSKAGQVISERRSSLKPNIVNKLLFLNKNSFLSDLN